MRERVMKLQCPREGLLMATQLVQKAVPTRTTIPILAFIKAIAEDDRLILIAMDSEVGGIRYVLRGVRVEEAGEALFAADRLSQILRESGDEEVTIEADNNRCLLHTETSEFEMPSDNPAGYPEFPAFDEATSHELTAGALRTMIRRTAFAAAKESTKFAITGVLWEVEGSHLRMIATDSKRLAFIEGPVIVHGGDSKGQSQVVPTKVMQLLESNLSDDDEKIRITLRSQDVLFHTERSTIYGRLVQGRFPPYRDIIPKKSNAKIELQVLPFLGAVRQAAIMADTDSKRVTFHFAPKKLTLEAQGATTGRSKVAIPLDYDGPPIDINFDPALLVDMFRILEEGAPITLELVDSVRPATFRSGKEYLYLVMPLS